MFFVASVIRYRIRGRAPEGSTIHGFLFALYILYSLYYPIPLDCAFDVYDNFLIRFSLVDVRDVRDRQTVRLS